jgi:hypothetical protein
MPAAQIVAPTSNRGGQDKRHKKRGGATSATGSPMIAQPTKENKPYKTKDARRLCKSRKEQ